MAARMEEDQGDEDDLFGESFQFETQVMTSLKWLPKLISMIIFLGIACSR